MFMKFIDAAFGPRQGLGGFLQKISKALLCFALAALTYFGMYVSLNRYVLPENKTIQLALSKSDKSGQAIDHSLKLDPSGNIKVLTDYLQIHKSKLEVAPFAIGICGRGGNFANECEDKNHLLAVTLAPVPPKAPALPNPVATSQKDKPPITATDPLVIIERRSMSFIPSVSVVHSVHTISREIERLAFNKADTPPSALKLCNGTRRVLERDKCEISAVFEDSLDALLSSSIGKARWPALLLGPIQFITLAVFFYVILETYGRKARYVTPTSTFLVKSTSGTKKRVELKPQKELDTAMKAFVDTRITSIPDELIAQTMVLSSENSTPIARTENAGEGNAQGTSAGRMRTALVGLEGFREYLVGEAEARLDDLNTMNETMMKLAFLGTVIGIALALNEARSLDAANPVSEMLTKARMFGSIGAAFGTTMLGVALSIIASVAIQSLHGSWMNRINDAFRSVLELTRDLPSEISSRYAGMLRERVLPSPSPDPTRDIGLLVIIAIVMWALIWLASPLNL